MFRPTARRSFDVLGELFEGHALRDLLVDAIRYGDRPETKAELFRKVDGAVDVSTIEQLVAERKLTSEGMDPNAVVAVREEMERAQARRLQPHFIGSFFREAFTLLGGRIAERERGRFEITRVPSVLKERNRLIGRGDPVLDRYARVTFEKTLIIGQPQAELLAPGHPLLDAAVDVVLERFSPLLGQGAVLVDDADDGSDPHLLVYLEHAVRDGRVARSGEPRVISQRLHTEVKARKLAEIDNVEREVRARLTRKINYWDAHAARLREEERAGKEQPFNASNAEATAQRLVERLHKRQAELDRERQITALPPVLKGAALVVRRGSSARAQPPCPSPLRQGSAKTRQPAWWSSLRRWRR